MTPRARAPLAILLLLLLAPGCAGTADDPVDDGGDLTATGDVLDGAPARLHFVLHTPEGWHPEGEEYLLHARGQRYPLQAHTEETRAQHPDLFLEENGLRTPPTHYAEGVDLPTDTPSRIHVTQRTDHAGLIAEAHGPEADHALALVAIHIPETHSRTALERMAAAGTLTEVHQRYYVNRGKGDDPTSALSPDLLATYGPPQIAETLLFHHPELMTNDAADAATVMHQHIQTAPGLMELAEAIASQGPGGWYDLHPIVESDGTQAVSATDHDGDGAPDAAPMWRYQPKDAVLEHGLTASQHSLRGAKNDTSLKDKLWRTQDGTGHLEEDPAPMEGSRDGYQFALAHHGFHHGLRTTMSTDGEKVTLSFRNDYVRHLSVFVEFYDEKKQPVTPASWEAPTLLDLGKDLGLDDGHRRFLTLLDPVPLILGIPIAGDYADKVVTFTWPTAARYARLRAGGLGFSGPSEFDVVILGAALTGIFEVAVPTVLLGLQSGTIDIDLKPLWKDVATVSAVLQFAIGILGDGGSKITLGNLLKKFGVAAANFLWGNAKIRQKLFEAVAESEFEDCVPFVGWALLVVDMAATAAALIETSAEVATSPLCIDNTITASHDVDVVIAHDPKDNEFPASATHYKVVLKLGGNITRTAKAEMPGTTWADPLTVAFDGVPAGGHFDLEVTFYSDSGWVAGHVLLSKVASVNDAGSDHQTCNVTIKENLIKLTADTTWQHKDRLAFDGDDHVWEAGAGPTATIADLDHSASGNAISELSTLHLSPRIPALGYAWRGFSPDQVPCPGVPSNGQLYAYQTISTAPDPEDEYRPESCGTEEPLYLALDETGSATEGDHYLVSPKDGLWHVRALTLEEGGFTVSEGSLGTFAAALDGFVVHPAGRLIGISRQNSKLLVLEPPDGPVDDDEAPAAIPLAGRALSQEGLDANPTLLASPIAMRLDPQDTVLVLDDVHAFTAGTPDHAVRARLKAFTYDGTPVPRFAGAHHLDLSADDDTHDLHYLDFAVDIQGYIFVLYYVTPQDDTTHKVTAADYRLDVFEPAGTHLSRTNGVAAARLAMDPWRNLYSLNYEVLAGPGGRTEPTVSQWIPETPAAD
jgi:hypothetical protein